MADCNCSKCKPHIYGISPAMYFLKEINEMNTLMKQEIDKYDAVNHPKHYTSHPSGVECIDITRHMGFNLGNAFKYIWRADLKANAIEDLKKAKWYLEDEIKRREVQNGKEINRQTAETTSSKSGGPSV